MIDRLDFFAARLAFETDPSDVHADRAAGRALVVVDVRSSEAFAQGRVSGALHMPHSEIAHRAPEEIPADAEVVVYCWSPDATAVSAARSSSLVSAIACAR